jgi:dihydropteroate synthase
VVGVSRKGFLGRLSGVGEPARRDPASLAAGLVAVQRGASVLRVHDVAGAVQALAVLHGLERVG